MQEQIENEAVARLIPISEIAVQDGFNPRNYFNDNAMEELVDSVRTQGVLQSILVRPAGEGRYHVVAGERRFRAAQRAGLSAIPALVRELDEQQALAAATAENGSREDISVAEEARLAQRAISVSDGDREEAAKLLGWKRSRIDARLLLLHAADSVLDALERREISVGHAELLATIPKSTQEGTLAKIIEDGYTVAELKGKLGEFTRELARARFDTAGCQGCPFNSSTQASLFEFSVGPGRCSNQECWTQKNEAHVAAVVTEQQDNFPAVYRDSERDAATRTILFEQGKNGVGPEQLAACKSCQFYGASVSTEPGREGAVTEGVCFNLTCNKKMIAAFAKAQEVGSEKAVGGKETGRGDKPATGVAPSKPATKPKTPAGTPKAVTDKADAFVRQQAVREHRADETVMESLALFGLFQLADTSTSTEVKSALAKFGVKESHKSASADLLSGLLAADPAHREAARQLLTIHLLGQRENAMSQTDWQAMAKAVVTHRQPDLSRSFMLDEAYLRAHTKSGMEALLKEAKFDTWLDARDDAGAFAKLMKRKVDDIVRAVFPERDGFDFKGFVPSSVRKQAGVANISTEKA